MPKKDVAKLIGDCIEEVILDVGFELVDFEFIKEGPGWVLRVFIDKEGGVAIDDCETFSRKLERLLDEKDPIPQAYMLEVSSPGIDRPLKKPQDYEKYKGRLVDLKLYKSVNNTKEYQGELLGLYDNEIAISTEIGELRFQRNDVAICRLAVIF